MTDRKPLDLDIDAVSQSRPEATATEIASEAICRAFHPEATDDQIARAVAINVAFVEEDIPPGQGQKRSMEIAEQIRTIFAEDAS